MLVTAAAKRWKVERASCRAQAVKCFTRRREKLPNIGELAAMRHRMPVRQTVGAQAPEDFKLNGTSAKRLDAHSQVTERRFTASTFAPGVKIATLANRRVFGGRVKSVDDAAAKAVKACVRSCSSILRRRGGRPMGRRRKGWRPAGIQWDEGPHARSPPATIVRDPKRQRLARGVAQNTAMVANAMASAVTKVEAT